MINDWEKILSKVWISFLNAPNIFKRFKELWHLIDVKFKCFSLFEFEKLNDKDIMWEQLEVKCGLEHFVICLYFKSVLKSLQGLLTVF